MTDESTPPQRPGLLHEHGPPMPAPWEPIELPDPDAPRREKPTTRPISAFAALAKAKGPELVAFLTQIPRAPGEPAMPDAPPAPPSAEQTERELHRLDLLELQRHGPTSHAAAMLERCMTALQVYHQKGVKVPRDTDKETEHWQQTVALCERRDRLQRERQRQFPGCWCLGLGGRHEVGISVRTPEGGVLFSENDPPLTWSTYCPCPDGQEAKAEADRQREAMRERGLARRAIRLLGSARIPAGFEDLDLTTYPDQTIASRVERWYLSNLGEVAKPEGMRPWLLLSGPNRRGKTGLAIGVVKLALARQQEAVFRTVPDLLDELRSTYDKDNPACHSELLGALKHAALLVLDDLGSEKLTDWTLDTMYSLLNERHLEQRMTVITTNLGWPAGTTRFDSQELIREVGERIWWRLRPSSNHLPITGPVLGLDRPSVQPPPDSFEKW